MVYLKKRSTVEVASTYSPGSLPAFGPQEPRRPRFSFFYLHAVKELTPQTLAGKTSSEAKLPNSENTRLLPVARQHPCPFKIEPPISGSARSTQRRRQYRGYKTDITACQHPIFIILESRSASPGSQKPETPAMPTFPFRPRRTNFRQRRLSDGGDIFSNPKPVNTNRDSFVILAAIGPDIENHCSAAKYRHRRQIPCSCCLVFHSFHSPFRPPVVMLSIVLGT